MIAPLISIIIVHWGQQSYLSSCLTSLESQTYKDFEVFIVDNQGGSPIRTDKWHFPIRVLSPGENIGYTAANNLAVSLANGHWVVLLNNDAYPAPTWLGNLLKAANENPNYTFFASRLLQNEKPERLDGAGDIYHISGLAWRQFYNMPADQFGLQSEEVFGPCAAAAMYKRDIFLQVGGFDEDYFAYHEDVDLSFRLRLNGYKCLYVHDAVVYHVGSGSTGVRSDFAVYYGHRNMVWTLVKNMPAPLLIKYMPVHLLYTLIMWVYYTSRGQGCIFIRAKLDAIKSLRQMWQKRKAIQAESIVEVNDINQYISKNLLAPILLRKV